MVCLRLLCLHLGLAWRWGCQHSLDKSCELFGGWIVAVAGHNSLCNGWELAEEIITSEKQCLGNRIWDLIYAKWSLCSALISGACLKKSFISCTDTIIMSSSSSTRLLYYVRRRYCTYVQRSMVILKIALLFPCVPVCFFVVFFFFF